jgi:large subunit ribosomal protein L9
MYCNYSVLELGRDYIAGNSDISTRKYGNKMSRMKVLLTQDVPNLGLAGEIHTVAGGYARNYLMPRGLGILATKGALKQAEEIRQSGIRRRAKERANAEAQAQVIAQHKLLFAARAGENDRLYGSITSADIAEELSKAVGFEIDRRRIQLEHPLRDLGIYDIELRLMAEVAPKFKVAVVREGETWEAAEARAAKPVEKSDAEEAAENDYE